MPHFGDEMNEKLRNYAHQVRELLRLAEEGLAMQEVPVLNGDLDVAGKENFKVIDLLQHEQPDTA